MTGTSDPRKRRIDFAKINDAALSALPAIVERWLADGKKQGAEWVALNPRRPDRRLGSFKVNLSTGRWGDFSIGVGGGDPVSLCAYLGNLSQVEAAKRLADMLGITNIYD